MDELVQLVRVWATRAKLQSGLYWLFFGLACGLGVGLVLAILARIFPLVSTAALIATAVSCALAGTLTAFFWPWLRATRTPPAAWARRFDQQFQLKERLSTALELRDGVIVTSNESVRRQQQADAAQTAETIDLRKKLPLRLSGRFAAYALAIGLALAATVALPNPQQEVLAKRAELQHVMDEQMKQLDDARQQVQQSQSLTEDQKKQIVQALDDAQKALSDPNTTPEKALAAINDAQSKMDALRDQTLTDQRDDLQRAGQSLAPDNLTNPLANSLENGNFQKAADQLRNLTQPQNGQPLSPDQQQRVADQLEQMARTIQNSDQATAQQLRDAAQQLRSGQNNAAQQALDKAADSLSKTAQKDAAQQQLSNAQASLDDTRRALSSAGDKSQQQAQAQQQSGQKGQSSAGGQRGSQGQPSGDNQQARQGGASDGSGKPQGQDGSQGANSDQSGNAQGLLNNGGGDSAHHEDVGSDNSVYAPSRINVAGQNVVLPQTQGQNVPNPNASANPGVGNQSTVPYQQVFAQYAKTADEALQNGQVPSDLRDYVHDYFSSLDPNARK